MLLLTLFCLELLALYFLSRHITITFSQLFLKWVNNNKFSGFILAILFLPGTLIHELAHYFMAVLLRVRVVNFTLLPKIGSDNIVLGSVGIVKPDLIRRFFIGIAPILVGTTILLSGIHYFFAYHIPFSSFLAWIFIYGVFTVSNTMFSSKADLEGAAELLLIIFLILFTIYFLGFRIPNVNLKLDFLYTNLSNSVKILLIPLAIDLLFLGVGKLLNYLIKTSHL
jgi:hypothetical protein